jgi:WD40 repeat protein
MRTIMSTRTLGSCLVILCLAAPAYGQSTPLPEPKTTYARAQVAEWITNNTFAVARWDGTVTVFRPPAGATEFGPVLTQALTTPANRPVEMIGFLSNGMFVTSNGSSSLAVWTQRKGRYQLKQLLTYPMTIGTANSATVAVREDGARVFISGHENGHVLIWGIQQDKLRLIRTVDAKSPNPIPSEFPLKNIRGLASWRNGYVVTGSEDGDLTLLRLHDGAIVVRLRYNSTAQRGINAISVRGDYLLLANCSVGVQDRNLWLYRIKNDAIEPLDSVNLIAKEGLPQVFDFDADLFADPSAPQFLASTEEGLLWHGRVSNDKLVVADNTSIACAGGAAIDIEPQSGLVAVAAFDVMLFTAPAPSPARPPAGDREPSNPSRSQPRPGSLERNAKNRGCR